MDRESFRKALATLEDLYPVRNWAEGRDPFETLVAIIISQSTTRENERRALRALRQDPGISPTRFHEAGRGALERGLRQAGLQRQKSRVLAELSRVVLERYGGDLTRLLTDSTETSRQRLLDLPGVGPKTADVFLSVVGNRPMFPVDTHLARLAGRWQIASGGYEALRAAYEAFTPAEKRRSWHLVLIEFCRDVCTARKPRCPECPVAHLCPARDEMLAMWWS